MTSTEIKQIIMQGGVAVNAIKTLDWNKRLRIGDLVKFGKRKVFKVV